MTKFVTIKGRKILGRCDTYKRYVFTLCVIFCNHYVQQHLSVLYLLTYLLPYLLAYSMEQSS